MSDTAFTPGPWKVVSAQHATGFARQILPRASRSAVARVCGDPRPSSENEANANLIAAAPDMFEALDLYQKSIGPLTGKPLTDEQWKRLHEVFAIAAAALRKARGESA